MFDEKIFLLIAVILYGLSSAFYISCFVLKKSVLSVTGSWITRIGFIVHSIALILRFVEAGRLPLTSQYEFAASFSWGIVFSYLVLEWKYKLKVLGLFAMPIILLVTFYTIMQSSEIKPLMPSLQSNWLIFHVGTAVFSYGAFAIACAVSVMYIIKENLKRDSFTQQNLPHLDKLDQVSYRAIAFGFFMLTLVIATGAIWAERAWGRYWRWDPKETWSFITWVIYAIYLHVRMNRSWKNKKAAWYAIIGFGAIIFTYIGVNTFMVGYHSY